MSIFGGGGDKVKPSYTGLATQTSTSILPVPLCWGQQRIAPNIFWQADFASHKVKQKSGKGLGGQATSYTYSGSFMLGLCEGPITGVPRVWKEQSTVTSYTSLGFSLFVGTNPQAPWGYLTSNYPAQALHYAGLAFLAVANYDLGQSNSLQQHSFEVQSVLYNTQVGGSGDADPALVIEDFLTNNLYGAQFPLANINTASLLSSGLATTTGDAAFQTYCRAMGFGLSPLLAEQEASNDVLDRWTQICNTEICWTGSQLKFLPRGDSTVTGHGVTYVPVNTVRYVITDSDFIRDGDDDPVILNRVDPEDAYNSINLTILDRTNEYNSVPVPWKDQGLIDQYGLKIGNDFDASKEVCDVTMASTMIALMGQRNAYIRNGYSFTLPSCFVLLEPGDIVQLVDAQFGTFNVKIRTVEEADDGNGFDLNFTAEEYPGAVSGSVGFPTQSTTNSPINTNVNPGPVNTPVILEPPSSMTHGVAQVWAAVSGGDNTSFNPNWGGCYVWISTDGVSYQQEGTIDAPARQGKLTAILATYTGSNPDTAHTLAVSTAISNGELTSVTAADAANAITLCYVDGELISYQDATLTGTNAYNLGTKLYRGLYGSTIGAHAIGTQFARLDDNVFQFDLPPQYIGVTLHLKFQSFNIFGGGVQDLSACTDYTYSPVGTGYGTGTGGKPKTPTGLTATAAGLQQVSLSWTLNIATDNVTNYGVYRATGASQPFGSATKIATTAAPTYLDSGLAAGQAYTYFIVATNVVGDSPNSTGVNSTTSSTSTAIWRAYGSLAGQPTSAQELFDIIMVGDEKFAIGLTSNVGGCLIAPTGAVTLPIKKNVGGTVTTIGSMNIAAGATTATWSFSAAYNPAAGDRLQFYAPTTLDATLAGLSYTFIASR